MHHRVILSRLLSSLRDFFSLSVSEIYRLNTASVSGSTAILVYTGSTYAAKMVQLGQTHRLVGRRNSVVLATLRAWSLI